MDRVLKVSKKFVLGICNCECKTVIAIRNERRKLARYVKGHNVKDFVKHGPEHPSWKGGKSHNVDGYVLIWHPNHPRNLCGNYIFEHVLIMEEYLGRYLTEDEIVHHINEKKDDNRLENLALLSEHEHKSYHTMKMWKDGKYAHLIHSGRGGLIKPLPR